MLGADKGTPPEPLLDGNGLRIGIVQARFNARITHAMYEACSEELSTLGVTATDIQHLTVPGALEVPTALQALAQNRQPDSGCNALIALGCVIRGGTYHFELVCHESAAGVSRVALDAQIPIANAILTVENMEQAIARQTDKARDAARAAVEMANLVRSLRSAA